ncbi:MAG: hypothetical protein KH321_01490 [Clostridium sp.]|jgi:hypothetical protein|nr:hypothetical protein [Clostridium sp.]
MHEYYFKIKKGDLEFEFSTTDKFTFEEKLSDWINGIVHGAYIEPPHQPPAQTQEQQHDNAKEPVQRSGFIDVKNLSSINDLTTPVFDSAQKANIVEEVNFERALEESMQNPKTEVVEKVDMISDFEGYLHSYNPQNSIDNLVVTALYILNIENKERFTIKQLNAKLVPLTGKPVDHSVIEDAMNQNLIRIVPDLTGTSEYTEYTLTDEGEGYFVQ